MAVDVGAVMLEIKYLQSNIQIGLIIKKFTIFISFHYSSVFTGGIVGFGIKEKLEFVFDWEWEVWNALDLTLLII